MGKDTPMTNADFSQGMNLLANKWFKRWRDHFPMTDDDWESCIQELTDVLHILGSGNEGSRHKINAVLDAEDDVFLILLGQVRTGHDLVGEGHALAVAEGTTHQALSDNVITHDFFNLEFHQTVIDGQHITGL